MNRAVPLALAALLAAPGAADAAIRVVDLQTGTVRTAAAGQDVRPLGWHGGALLGFDGAVVRRYPGAKRLLQLRGAHGVALGRDRIAAVSGGGEHSDRVVVVDLHGRRRGAHLFAGFEDSLAWSRDGTRLAVGWTAQAHLRSHVTILTRRLKPLRTVDVPSPVSMTGAGWSPDGRTLTFVADARRLGASGGPRLGEVRSLDVASGRQTVRFRGTRCDSLACELLEEPAAAGGGRVGVVGDFTGVTVLRPGARPQAAALPAGCEEVDEVAWAGASLAVVYIQGNASTLALLPQRRTVASLGRGEVDDLLVSGRRAAVYQR